MALQFSEPFKLFYSKGAVGAHKIKLSFNWSLLFALSMRLATRKRVRPRYTVRYLKPVWPANIKELYVVVVATCGVAQAQVACLLVSRSSTHTQWSRHVKGHGGGVGVGGYCLGVFDRGLEFQCTSHQLPSIQHH